jgi:GNAT superfamily N-acetyltransferase
MLGPLDDTACQHPALEADLELAALLPHPGLAPLHLTRERRRVAATLAEGGWGVAGAGALTLVRALPWDTVHFGLPCADLVRLYACACSAAADLERLVEATLAEARRRGLRLLSARLLAHQTQALHALQRNGFLLLDTSVELGARYPLRDAPAAAGVVVRTPTAADIPSLETIAATFVGNRFHRDERLPRERATALYVSWVRGAAEGRHGRLLLAEVDGAIAGFATFSPADDELEVGTIGLVAVAPVHRGRRLLAPLVAAAAAASGGQAVITSTQVSNASALRGFARVGLLPFAARHVLHGWLD